MPPAEHKPAPELRVAVSDSSTRRCSCRLIRRGAAGSRHRRWEHLRNAAGNSRSRERPAGGIKQEPGLKEHLPGHREDRFETQLPHTLWHLY